MTEPGEISTNPNDADYAILDNARRLISSKTEGQPLMMHSSPDGSVLTEDMLELARRTEQISLASAAVGDVIWWKTASGTNGYFAVQEPYTDAGTGVNGMKRGNGKFLITRREGHPLGDQRGTGSILGATLGGGLKKDTIIKGATLEYQLKVGEKDKSYTTTPVTEMGVIENRKLSQ